MRKRGKVDDNQKAIVAAFRKAGATVQHLSDVGGGCPDIVIGYMGVNVLVEIKDGNKPPSARKLTPDQVKFHDEWRGVVAVVKNTDEVIGLLNSVCVHKAMCGDRWLKTGNPFEEQEQ